MTRMKKSQMIYWIKNSPIRRLLITSPIFILIITGIFLVRYSEAQLLTISEIRSKIIGASSNIKNYAFKRTVEGTTKLFLGEQAVQRGLKSIIEIPTSTTSKGIVDVENREVYSESEMVGPGTDMIGILQNEGPSMSKSEFYIINDVIYEGTSGQWIKSPLKNKDEYFLIERLIDIVTESYYIEIIEENPLHIRIFPDKEIIGKKIIDALYKNKPEFTRQFDILYATAVEDAFTDCWLDQDFRITEAKSKVIINLDKTTIIPKKADINPIEEKTQIITISSLSVNGYNSQPRITLPLEAYNAQTLEEALPKMLEKLSDTFGTLFNTAK